MACHIPPLKKWRNKGKCHYPQTSQLSLFGCVSHYFTCNLTTRFQVESIISMESHYQFMFSW